MFSAIYHKTKEIERRLRRSFGQDISTPKGRRAAWWYFMLIDHAVLRILWKNFHRLDAQVWRSNHPSPKMLRQLRDKAGLRTVVNLRGKASHAAYLFEREACETLGLEMIDLHMSAHHPPPRASLIRLLEIFRTAERPMLIHCKSGADRTGLAAALYLHIIKGMPLEKARRQLHWRFLHFKHGTAGVQDFFFEHYLATAGDMPLEAWIHTRYDEVELARAFSAHRGQDDAAPARRASAVRKALEEELQPNALPQGHHAPDRANAAEARVQKPGVQETAEEAGKAP